MFEIMPLVDVLLITLLALIPNVRPDQPATEPRLVVRPAPITTASDNGPAPADITIVEVTPAGEVLVDGELKPIDEDLLAHLHGRPIRLVPDEKAGWGPITDVLSHFAKARLDVEFGYRPKKQPTTLDTVRRLP